MLLLYYTSLNTHSITFSFANKMLQRKQCISGNLLTKLYALWNYRDMKKPLNVG